jgi:DNA-binding MarR family transcriptional regulator
MDVDSSHYSPSDLVRYVVGTAKLCENAIAPTGLTLMQYHILDRLGRSENGLPQKELVGAPETPQSSAVTSLLNRLERNRWIKRSISSWSGKERLVKLTPKGKNVWHKVQPQFEQILKLCLIRFSPEEIKNLAKANKDLRDALNSNQRKMKRKAIRFDVKDPPLPKI